MHRTEEHAIIETATMGGKRGGVVLTQVWIAVGAVLGVLVAGWLVSRQTAKARQKSSDRFWKIGRLYAVADMLAVGWLWLITFRLNGAMPDSNESAIASVIYVALTALLVVLCGPVSDETEDRAWLLVMLLAFVGALVLAVQFQSELSNIGNL